MAKEVRATLQKMSQIAEVYVDNTSRAVIRAKDGVALDKDAVNGAIKPRKVKVLKEVRRPIVGTVYTLKADGYA